MRRDFRRLRQDVSIQKGIPCFICKGILNYLLCSSQYDASGKPLKSDEYLESISGFGTTHKLFEICPWTEAAGLLPVLFREYDLVSNPERGGYFVPAFGELVGNVIVVCKNCLAQFNSSESLQKELSRVFLIQLADALELLSALFCQYGINDFTPVSLKNFNELSRAQKNVVLSLLAHLIRELGQVRKVQPVHQGLQRLELIHYFFISDE